MDLKIVVLLVHVRCVAHQINLAAKATCANLGGNSPAECQQFTRRFIGQSKVFGHSCYISRVWAGALKGMSQMRFMSVDDARDASLEVATAHELQHKIELLSFLCKFATNHAVLPDKFVKAIVNVSKYLNLPISHWIEHTTAVRITNANDDSNHISYVDFLSALATIIHRVTKVFAESRWGTAPPAYAQTGLWLIVYSFSAIGLSKGFDREKVEANAREWAKQHQLDSDDGFKFELCTRLGRSFDFHWDRTSCWECVKSCFCLLAIQRCLFFAFAADSGRHPDLIDFAKQFDLGGDLGGDGNHNGGGERLGASNRVNSVREQEPPAVAFARLQRVKGILRESCSQYVRLDSDAPPDVQAYRVAFVSGENASDRIQQHWRSSMPGLGRLWYSLVFDGNGTLSVCYFWQRLL